MRQGQAAAEDLEVVVGHYIGLRVVSLKEALGWVWLR